MVVLAGLAGALTHEFWQILAARVLQACGTSTAFPCAVGVIRGICNARGSDPSRGLASVAMANSAGAALGPVLGGALIALAGWPALFWVNVPMGLLATGAALAWVPADGEAQRRPARQLVTDSDLPGITLFAAAATSGVLLVLSLPTRPRWLLAPLAVCGLFGFILREHRCKKPFVNLRMLRSNHALLMVYVQFLAFNVAYYAAFYGLPQWLESVRSTPPEHAGLLILPIAALGALATPLASRLIHRTSMRATLSIGAAVLVAGSLGLLLFDQSLPITAILLVCAVLGIPYALINLSLQNTMYAAADDGYTSVAAGLYQTARYLGAITATSILGVVFAGGIRTTQLHTVGIVMVAISFTILVAAASNRLRQHGNQ